METRATTTTTSDSSDDLCPKVLSNEQRKQDRASKRAAHLEQRRLEEAKRKARMAEQMKLQATSSRSVAATTSSCASKNKHEDPVLRSNPELGHKIMTGVSGLLALARSYGVGGLDESGTTLIKESIKYTLSAAEDVRQHIQFTLWIMCYILMSWVFPSWHAYILMIWINTLAVALSIGQYFWPRAFSHGNSFLSKFCFNAREYCTSDRFAQGRVSQCFRVIFHIYTGFVNWLFLQAIEHNGAGTSSSSVLPLWWLLQVVCFAIGQFALFESMYAYSAIVSILTFVCILSGWSIPMLLVVMALVAFVAWCFSDVSKTQVATTQRHKSAFLSSVGAWALSGLFGTAGWTVEFWAALPVSISIQWSFVWTLIVFTILSVLKRENTTALCSRDTMYWMASLGVFSVLLYIGYTPLIFIHMAVVLKFVALPWIIDTMHSDVSATINEKNKSSSAVVPESAEPSVPPAMTSDGTQSHAKVQGSLDDSAPRSEQQVDDVSNESPFNASMLQALASDPRAQALMNNPAIMQASQAFMSNSEMVQASLPMAMEMFRSLQSSRATTGKGNDDESAGSSSAHGTSSILRDMGLGMMQQAQQNPALMSNILGMAQQFMQANNSTTGGNRSDLAVDADELD